VGEQAAWLEEGGAEIRARGNEPFWFIRLEGEGGEMRTPDDADPILFGAVTARVHGGVRVFLAHDALGRVLELELRNEPCEDTMSGEALPLTAVRHWQSQSDPGCAWEEER
jgi:uncharacterized membrane protein